MSFFSNYFSILPARVRYDRDLPQGAKLLYSEISSAVSLNMYSCLTNKEFLQFFHSSERTMQRWLDALLKAGFIYKVTLTDETNQQQRYLFIKKSHAIDFAISNGLTENDVVYFEVKEIDLKARPDDETVPYRAYYAVLTKEVREDKELDYTSKLLYAEITALCNEYGYSFASNKYFSLLFNCSRATINRKIEELEEKHYLFRYILNNSKRLLFTDELSYLNYISTHNSHICENVTPGGDTSETPPGDTSETHNIIKDLIKNTSIYNTKKIDIDNGKLSTENDVFLAENVYSMLYQKLLEYDTEFEKRIDNIERFNKGLLNLSSFLAKKCNEDNFFCVFSSRLKPEEILDVITSSYNDNSDICESIVNYSFKRVVE